MLTVLDTFVRVKGHYGGDTGIMDGTPRPAFSALDTIPQEVGPPTQEPPVITPKFEGEDPRRRAIGDTRPHTKWRDLPKSERDRRSVTTCVIQVWNQFGKIPTVEYICNYKHMNREHVEKALRNPQNIADLIEAGIIPDDFTSWEDVLAQREPGLTTKQVNAVRSYFSILEEKKSLGAALAEVDVSVTEWNGWMRDPIFAGYVRDVGSTLYGDRQPTMDMALIREAESGDVPALRLAMEVTGRIKQDKNGVDAGVLLAHVMQIIGRHVDRSTQADIGAEIMTLASTLRGGSTSTVAVAPPVIDQAGRVLDP